MRFSLRALFVLALSALASSSHAQQPAATQTAPSALQRDPQALSILSRSFAAMGGNNVSAIHDTVLQVQVTSADPTGQRTYSGTLKTLAGGMLREDLNLPEGPAVLVQRGGIAQSSQSALPAKLAGAKSLADAGITHIPVFSILKDWADPSLRVEYVGLEKLDAAQAYHVRVHRTPDPKIAGSEFSSQVEFFIDAESFLVSRLIYSMHPATNLAISEPVEVRYQDFRLFSGILVPFQVSSFVRGHLLSSYTVTSFAANQNLSDADFQFK
jgi:hypothetical protein